MIPTSVTALMGQAAEATQAPRDPHQPDRAQVARLAQEFESMLLRQLLSTSHIGSGQGQHGEMALDSLAQTLSAHGGFGLARQIEATLTREMDSSSPEAGRSAHAGQTPQSTPRTPQ